MNYAQNGYPRNVKDEVATIMKVLEGFSLARFGDGELKLMDGDGYRREPPNKELGAELRRIFQRPAERCIVGIPTMSPSGPKYKSWIRHEVRFQKFLDSSVMPQYYSAFVTRPDSAPWIKTQHYATLMRSIWLGRKVVVVCEKNGSMFDTVRMDAKEVTHVRCTRKLAYSRIDWLEGRVRSIAPEVAILSAGPTATCLAHRLSNAGIHAVDLGSCGGWIGELLK